MKFKIGDKIIRNRENPDSKYDFTGKYDGGKIVKPGDVFVVSVAGNGNYSVEGAYTQTPNWSSMEENFDLFTTWAERYKVK